MFVFVSWYHQCHKILNTRTEMTNYDTNMTNKDLPNKFDVPYELYNDRRHYIRAFVLEYHLIN